MSQRKFFIQWDSTNDCNLNCSHCYHNREGEYHSKHQQNEENLMAFEEVKSMIDDLDQTCKRWSFSPRFQISGGEPLKRGDLLEIIDYTKSLNIETILLTNGTLITRKVARELKLRGIKRLQISIDGNKETNNRIRGMPYAYDKALEGIRNCATEGIKVTVSMTAMQCNKSQLEDIIVNSIRCGAKYVGFQSYVPNPKLGINDPEFIDSRGIYQLSKETRKLEGIYGDQIHILQTEVLWQLMQWDTKLKREARKTGKFLSGCGAGFSGLSVLSDGTVYPCRRLPIIIGHISEGIRKIMLESEVLKNLRDFDIMKENCCERVYYCRGCRAIAYATTGDYMARDPMCFKDFVKEEDIQPRVIRRW